MIVDKERSGMGFIYEETWENCLNVLTSVARRLEVVGDKGDSSVDYSIHVSVSQYRNAVASGRRSHQRSGYWCPAPTLLLFGTDSPTFRSHSFVSERYPEKGSLNQRRVGVHINVPANGSPTRRYGVPVLTPRHSDLIPSSVR